MAGLRVLVWGTYDFTKPRTRILLDGLEQAGAHVETIHAPVWGDLVDKSTVGSMGMRVRLAARWITRYPGLLARLVRAERHDVVLVLYLGQLDVLMLWPVARLRGFRVVWDQFISLYDTVVEDRRMVSPRHPLAALLFAWEWLACRLVDKVLIDTEAHAQYVRRTFGLAKDRVGSVIVGAEPEAFQPDEDQPPRDDAFIRVLFYGQFIPLHGIETIVRAAQQARDAPIQWTLIGKGQEEDRIRALLDEGWPPRLEWVDWVEYETLCRHIQQADVCLGIFGDTDKASRVIPNKVFQILHAGRPLITRDSPAIRELLSEADPGVYLVPPADPDALLAAIEKFSRERPRLSRAAPLHAALRERTAPPAIGRDLLRILEAVAK
jgi:glycosyltransferase involved in cell wall biosynthesis